MTFTVVVNDMTLTVEKVKHPKIKSRSWAIKIDGKIFASQFKTKKEAIQVLIECHGKGEPATSQDIANTNRQIREQLVRVILEHQKEVDELTAQIRPPCKSCPYDGLYRCETCRDSGFAGYNQKDYPN